MRKCKDVPICSFIAVTLILIFSLYVTSVLKSVPCHKDLTSVLITNFIHTDYVHLVSNLYALYAISKVEKQLGTKKFTQLIILLLTLSSIIEVAVHRVNTNIPCSIGFSGVLFGITTWEIIHNNESNQNIIFNLLASIFLKIFISSFSKTNISIVGHTSGIISGFISTFFIKKIK